jgi:hypothetical protein
LATVLQPSTSASNNLLPRPALPRRGFFVVVLYGSRVSRIEKDLIAGAARRTTGSIVAQEISHDASQCLTNTDGEVAGRLAMAAAIRQVRPDWITLNTK